MENIVAIENIIGKTMVSVDKIDVDDSDAIIFTADTGEVYSMRHIQDCCETVTIDDITGELDYLVGSPILDASEETNNDNPRGEYDDSFTWTFYKFRTLKGWVDIRWYGSSNGYYSESVDFVKIK